MRGKVARRIFALFVISAFLPAAALRYSALSQGVRGDSIIAAPVTKDSQPKR